MDVCFSPNLELRLILETHVVITSFEEELAYVPVMSEGVGTVLPAQFQPCPDADTIPRRLEPLPKFYTCL
jgi:hypothetical protein